MKTTATSTEITGTPIRTRTTSASWHAAWSLSPSSGGAWGPRVVRVHGENSALVGDSACSATEAGFGNGFGTGSHMATPATGAPPRPARPPI